MALRQLTEADCGQYNPLVQLTTHLTRDHTFAENVGQTAFPNSSDQLVQQFLEETRVAPQTFRMGDLMREMHEIESQRTAIPPVPAVAVKDHLSDNIWAVEYLGQQRAYDEASAPHHAVWAEITARERDLTVTENKWITQYQEAIANHELQESACAAVESLDDPKFAYSKFLKFMKQADDGDVISDEAQVWADQYGDDISAILNTTGDDNLSRSWDEELVNSENGPESNKFWNKLQDEWKKMSEQDNSDDSWVSQYNNYYDPYKEYEFVDDNPMMETSNALDRGKELLKLGDLPGAVLCFEAAVKQNSECAEAWQLLGTSQAENEQDPNAICALKRCLQIEPNNLGVLMALAVSYTNESYHLQACQSLVNWLLHHPEYSNVVPPDFQLTGQVTTLVSPEQHKAVQDLFIKVAQRQPINPDYEVQCGLGVLFNLSAEYEKAADCFRVALNIKPNDALLWNRLGATLANGNKPEEAVDAYHRALNLAPGFIRARYNVGITCINLGAYKEAVEHFLMALNQQARAESKSQMSDTIWTTLRMCVALMNRADLRKAVDDRDLNILNNAFDINEN